MSIIDKPKGRSDSGAIYPIFVSLYVVGFIMEMVERWQYPGWTAAGVLLGIATIAFARERAVFLAFLILTTTYFLLFRFPEVANHINLLIACNILLILGLAYSYVSRIGRKDFAAYFQFLLAPVRLMLIVTFSVAGFHKLNRDFFNPEVSCIGEFLGAFRWTLAQPVFDRAFLSYVPVVTVVSAIGLPIAWLVLRYRLARLSRWLLLGGLAIVVVTVPLSVSFAGDALSLVERHKGAIIVGAALTIVFWQLIEGPLLLVRRLQAYILFFAFLIHLYLGMIGFVDFQSLALALILAFMPISVVDAWNRQRSFSIGGHKVDRIHAYVALSLISGLLTGILLKLTPQLELVNMNAMQGTFFVSGVLIMVWPLVVGLLLGTREWRWNGVPGFDARTPKFLYLLPLFLLLFGMTSHLGLRTAGNFSMFSNLRTEGAASNHLLFGSNPLKLWGYQEDTVQILELNDEEAVAGHHYDEPLQGKSVQVIEFRKLVDVWGDAGMVVPITFEYQGQTITSQNIAADPDWRQDRWTWEMILLDFRVIQPHGPNSCRW